MITSRHPEWPAMKTSLLARIETLRNELELPRSTEDTAYTRGQIAEIRNIINTIEPFEFEAPQAKYT